MSASSCHLWRHENMKTLTLNIEDNDFEKIEFAAKKLNATTEDFSIDCLKLGFLKLLNFM